MEIATPLLLAIVAGGVATTVHNLIGGGPWALRPFCALWAALSIIAYVGLAGPFTLG